MAAATNYPVTMEARLDPDVSRWLWLVKWVLVIPHVVVLVFLWTAYVVTTIVAFFGIVFTGRYPRGIFEFNVGVLRWSWRVAYYSWGANGTDRYPPFSLADDPAYPTHLEVAYPDRLSRGLVLVKWWLLAIPHYLIVGVLIGGGSWAAWNVDGTDWAVYGNLLGILVLVAVVVLLVTGRYPRGLFDLILGLNRWVLRVAGYVGLMTDEYPPFRLDMGETEPGATLTLPSRPDDGGSPAGGTSPPPPPPSRGQRWTAGRVTSLILGVLLVLPGAGLLAGGGFVLWLDRTQRDANGFVTTEPIGLSTDASALVATFEVDRQLGTDWLLLTGPGATIGPGSSETIRIRVRPAGEPDVVVGIGRTDEVLRFLDGVAYADVIDLRPTYATVPGEGGAPAFRDGPWTAVGRGDEPALRWDVREGSWTVVVMNADGSAGVEARVDAGARLEVLDEIAFALLGVGVVLLVLGSVLIAVPAARASRREDR
jgi:hypothetical protein